MPFTSYLPLSVVRARFQAGLFAALCSHRPDSFLPLEDFINVDALEAYDYVINLQEVLNPSPSNKISTRGVSGRKLDTLLREAIGERPIPPFNVRPMKLKREWDGDGSNLHYFVHRDWQKKFPRFDGLGWPTAQAIVFLLILKKNHRDFGSSLSEFKTLCLETAYGPFGSDGKRSYNDVAKKVRKIEFVLRPPEVDFLELLRTAVTKVERDTAGDAERQWSSRGKMLLPEPPESEHPSWLWVISWIEGSVIRGAEADKVEKGEVVEMFNGTGTKQMHQKLWGRPNQSGGLLHYIGLRVNGHFPPHMPFSL